MAFSKIVIMGNLTADPEQRTTPGGTELTSFTIAVNTRGVGGREDSTAFYNCTMWGKRGEVLTKYVSKGQQLLASGTLTVRQYTAKDGSARQSLDVNVDDFSFVGNRGDNGGAASASAAPAADVASEAKPVDLSDIPF